MSERKFLFEATTANGRGASGHIQANSVSEARQRLVSSGHSNVVIHDDDFVSDLRIRSEKELGFEREAGIDLLVKRDPSPWSLMAYALRQNRNWFWFLVHVAVLAILALVKASWWVWVIAILIAGYDLYLLLRVGYVQWLHNEVYRSFWAADWERSRKLAERVRDMPLNAKLDSVKLQMDSRVAACLVMQGRVQEGYGILDPWREDPMYLGKIGLLHYLARDFAGAVAIQERIFANSGRDTSRIDLAQYLARFTDDHTRATELLDGLKAAEIVPMQMAFIGLGRGVIALKAERNEDALRHLSAAMDEFQKMAVGPWTWGAVSICSGYLAVVLSRMGDRNRALIALESLRFVTLRHGEDRLRDWLRAERLAS